MRDCGRILWNAIAICEMSQIYYLMGRRPLKGGELCKAHDSIRSIGSVTQSRDQTRFHQFGKYSQEFFWKVHWSREGYGKENVLTVDLEEYLDASEFIFGESTQKKVSVKQKKY